MHFTGLDQWIWMVKDDGFSSLDATAMFWFFGYRPGFHQVWFFRMGCSYRQNLDAVLLVFPTRIILLFMDQDLVFLWIWF
jgi:hypothetical protein